MTPSFAKGFLVGSAILAAFGALIAAVAIGAGGLQHPYYFIAAAVAVFGIACLVIWAVVGIARYRQIREQRESDKLHDSLDIGYRELCRNDEH